ncbi:hypothetical protein D0Z07_8988 [Hyphodiscus hymeniophilus]|uniref:Uncharacterized protein n=1 Tax=Hyphodiscus hymeniophilus TaxID=353542 RepID=A0A9P6SLE6_9HELO|nr:hypothetical protein D0Z07_8988 [Hyphodiscus hymeniophilus]
MMRRLDWGTRVGVRLIISIIFALFTVFSLYEWRAIASQPKVEIHPLHYDLATPIAHDNSETLEVNLDANAYYEVYSASTPDKKYFLVDFIDWKSINPNIIPHPSLEDTWVIVAQRDNSRIEDQTTFVEIACHATFQNGVLKCTHSPIDLPIAPTPGNQCKGDLAWFRYSHGPHDGRVFYGPQAPYTIFGSNSDYTCFGQFVQDFRSLMDWGDATFAHPGFEKATELQRPSSYGPIEKNYFMFWDTDRHVYVHYDVYPKRAFAKLGLDGSVGEDLAPHAAQSDDKCMAKYMPAVAPGDEKHSESIHQATNSLSVTMCKRSDPSCKPTSRNTFILTIFQWKSYIAWHSNYEPYIMLFEEKAPFKIHGISKKPFWIHGRRGRDLMEGKNENAGKGNVIEKRNNGIKPWNSTEMMYITSMSWKSHQQKYHGYLDDILFLAFGIEDAQSAGIDVIVGDLLMELGLCADS